MSTSAPVRDPEEAPRDPKPSSLFQCGLCKQRYKRPDHLARHVRSHYQYKPHRCHICGKAFSRTDLLNRHVASHSDQNGKTKSNPSGVREVQSRVSRACKACATNHLRCTESKPCKRCAEKGLECEWDGQLVMEDQPSEGSPEEMASQRGQDQRREVQPAQAQDIPYDSTMSSFRQQPLPTPQSEPPPAQIPSQQQQQDVPQHESTHQHDDTNMARPVLQQQPQDHDYDYPMTPVDASSHVPMDTTATPRFPDWNFLPGWQTPTAGGGPDLGSLAVPDFDLDEVDMQFLNVYNHAVPFEFGRGSQPELTFGLQQNPPNQAIATTSLSPETHTNNSRHHQRPPAASSSSYGPEAFRRHHWRFQPNTRDHAGAEEHNLSLPPNDPHEHASPESRISVNTRLTAAPLSVSTRDKILASVIRSCRAENLTRVVAFFPGVELLDKLLQYYLGSPLARADGFLHAPTFDPNAKRGELLLAMAAAGAVLTSDPTLAKLGYAMQEVVRPAVAALWESDNTLTRNLELLQAFLIHLEIGIWSGQSRKIEITESFLQAPLTMLRRAGKFKSSGYHDDASSSPMAPLRHDPGISGPELRERWLSWVHQESYKRTAFRLLTHDTSSSMCLLVNPLLSYAEVSLPLPCAPGLWAASTPDRWKALLVQSHINLQAHQTQPPPPTIADFADDPGAYIDASSSPSFDSPLANQAFLSYAWSLCWEYTQLSSLCRSSGTTTTTTTHPRRRWSALLLSSRQDELLKLLHHFRVVAEDLSAAAAADDARMKLEHILLHMHAPLEEIQTFAGMEGPEQAAGAQGVIGEWAASQAARTAVWHASQVVRVARRIARGAVQGPLAFSLYHAGLVLWTYALVSGGQQTQQQQQQQEAGQRRRGRPAEGTVFLDEDGESMALQRFTQLGAGRPCFRSGVPRQDAAEQDEQGQSGWETEEEEVFLEEPDKVMRALVQVLYSNHRGLPRPHLADRLIQLMETLQRSPGVRGS